MHNQWLARHETQFTTTTQKLVEKLVWVLVIIIRRCKISIPSYAFWCAIIPKYTINILFWKLDFDAKIK
jgi:hypothetical protein